MSSSRGRERSSGPLASILGSAEWLSRPRRAAGSPASSGGGGAPTADRGSSPAPRDFISKQRDPAVSGSGTQGGHGASVDGNGNVWVGTLRLAAGPWRPRPHKHKQKRGLRERRSPGEGTSSPRETNLSDDGSGASDEDAPATMWQEKNYSKRRDRPGGVNFSHEGSNAALLGLVEGSGRGEGGGSGRGETGGAAGGDAEGDGAAGGGDGNSSVGEEEEEGSGATGSGDGSAGGAAAGAGGCETGGRSSDFAAATAIDDASTPRHHHHHRGDENCDATGGKMLMPPHGGAGTATAAASRGRARAGSGNGSYAGSGAEVTGTSLTPAERQSYPLQPIP